MRLKKLSSVIPGALLVAVCAGFAFGQAPQTLTLQQAETMALNNHPEVLSAQLETSAAGEQVKEARAAYYPTVDGNLTGSQGNSLARIGAGTLSASRLFNRFGQGVTFSQLITDLGRTQNLVASSNLQASASGQNYQATRYDVLLDVHRTYYDALHAQALVRVAQETVSARQLLLDQVTTLANNNLRSQLDVSFAAVNVSQAKLLLLQAQDAVIGAFAQLTRALGSDQSTAYHLVDATLPSGPPPSADALVAQAINDRPELASYRLNRDAAYRFAAAEKDLLRPNVGMTGVFGLLPWINTGGTKIPDKYEGVGMNVDIPIFNGHLFTSRAEAARYKALEADQALRDQQEKIARDVRVAWANSVNAFQRIDVTQQFLQQAALALDLARGRYNLGLASIVELTQAQLNQTEAEIENLSAKYDYESQYDVLQYSIGALR